MEETKEQLNSLTIQVNDIDNKTIITDNIIENVIHDKDKQDDNINNNNDETLKLFKDKLLSKIVKVSLIDKRVLYGKLGCIDNLANLILHETIQEIPVEYISKINFKMEYYIRNHIKIQNYIKVKKEILDDIDQLKKMNEEFVKNKFYIGQTLIPSSAIEKLEVQKDI